MKRLAAKEKLDYNDCVSAFGSSSSARLNSRSDSAQFNRKEPECLPMRRALGQVWIDL